VMLPISFFPDPRRYIRHHDVCNIVRKSFWCQLKLTMLQMRRELPSFLLRRENTGDGGHKRLTPLQMKEISQINGKMLKKINCVRESP